LSTEDFIDTFVSSGLRVPITLVQELCNGPEAIPHVARILDDDTYWKVGGPGDGWSPIHALHILGCMKTPEALNVLIAVLRSRANIAVA
jgi:hypothetical protein